MKKSQNIVGIIQARMDSSRLPGKSMMTIEGKPLLEWVILRARAAKSLAALIVATSKFAEDQLIMETAELCGVPVYRGSKKDVLDRYYQAAKTFSADIIVRITADDPFKDPQLIDHFVDQFLKIPDCDFYGEDEQEPTLPEGMAVSVIRFSALQKAWRQARLPSEREHVIPYFWNHPEEFYLGKYRHPQNLSGFRFTIDYYEDLIFTREVYRHFRGREVFSMEEILRLLQENPHLLMINRNIARNEGYFKSIEMEKSLKGVLHV